MLTNNILVSEWSKKYSVSCKGTYGFYRSFSAAISACLEDKNCGAIRNSYCNDNNFRLCPANYQELESSYGTCIHIRPGNLSIHTYQMMSNGLYNEEYHFLFNPAYLYTHLYR